MPCPYLIEKKQKTSPTGNALGDGFSFKIFHLFHILFMLQKKYTLFHLLALAFFLVACEGEQGEKKAAFDRKKMLENVADNLILPAYTDLENSLRTLKSQTTAFVENPDAGSLSAVQNAWVSAYQNWQYANAYNFGAAGEAGLKKSLLEEIGTFPVSKTKIEAAVASGAYNLSDFNRDARGFLAVEYLVFGENFGQEGSQTRLLQSFENSVRRQYLLDLVENINVQVSTVKTAWQGSAREEFINNDGTEAGSSTSLLYNEFVKSFEGVKNFKLGLPMGKRPGQVQTEPQLFEAYYSGKSLEMMQMHLQAIENIWRGKSKNGTDGIGFEEYLKTVEGGTDLVQSTENQLINITAALNAVPQNEPLSVLVNQNKQPLENLYTELQKHTRFFKSDMSSLLGIAITYSSGDGD